MSAAAPPSLAGLRDALEDAVREACEAIRAVMGRGSVRVGHKWGEGPVTEADHAADEVLHRRLIPLVAGAHWLSEESSQAAPLVPGEPTWVVDPLDGTREFLRGLPEFGVSAGFFDGDRLVLGAAGLPAEREPVVYSGLLPPPDGGAPPAAPEARVDGEPLPPLGDGGAASADGGGPGRIVVSRWDWEHRRIQRGLPYEAYPLGSAVVKLIHAATGRAGLYLSTGPRSVWDAAGGAAVLEAAGGALIGIDGRPLRLSPQRERIPPFVAGPRARALALLRRLGAEV